VESSFPGRAFSAGAGWQFRLIAIAPRTMCRSDGLIGLNDATDTDLRPFASHGRKLIMYHGWSDTSIAPMISVAYYTSVQRDLGETNVDRFMQGLHVLTC
jgi:hypothetical protein